jgi:hypothetical protein
MHRISAGLLIGVFGFALVGPAVFASGGDSNLPACCRRAGKHHCAMPDSAGSALQSTPCPLFPSAPNLLANRIVVFAGSTPPAVSASIVQPADPREAISISRVAFHRPGEKRGPPAFS